MHRNMNPRRPLGDVRGQAKGERLSEYFDFGGDPDKRTRKVTREELLALLTRKWLVERELKWYRRLWRFLRNRMGQTPAPIGGGFAPDCTCAHSKSAHGSGIYDCKSDGCTCKRYEADA